MSACIVINMGHEEEDGSLRPVQTGSGAAAVSGFILELMDNLLTRTRMQEIVRRFQPV